MKYEIPAHFGLKQQQQKLMNGCKQTVSVFK